MNPPSPDWLGEKEIMASVDGVCPHDGEPLQKWTKLDNFMHCLVCRRVWDEFGKRLPTVWWGGEVP